MKRILLLLLVLTLLFCGCTKKDEIELNEELYGNPYGRDYRGHVGDGKYQMWHIAGIDELTISESPNIGAAILKFEYDHCFVDNNLYFYSADGYAVVYAQSNVCKVFLTDPPIEVFEGEDPKRWGRDAENNYMIDKLTGEKYKLIIYLDSFDEYTQYEQNILNTLKKPKKFK